jgi:hypothetical protein
LKAIAAGKQKKTTTRSNKTNIDGRQWMMRLTALSEVAKGFF